jgi:hypothetical protein
MWLAGFIPGTHWWIVSLLLQALIVLCIESSKDTNRHEMTQGEKYETIVFASH